MCSVWTPLLLSHFLPIYFAINKIHQRIQTTCSHTSRCPHCHYCNVNFVLFHNVTCYIVPLLSCIKVNIAFLFNVLCTLVAAKHVLGRLELSWKRHHLHINLKQACMVSRPKTNNFLKPTLCTTCIHLVALGASKCMHVVHSVGFRAAYLNGALAYFLCIGDVPMNESGIFHRNGVQHCYSLPSRTDHVTYKYNWFVLYCIVLFRVQGFWDKPCLSQW